MIAAGTWKMNSSFFTDRNWRSKDRDLYMCLIQKGEQAGLRAAEQRRERVLDAVMQLR